jgi:hypothetical protein
MQLLPSCAAVILFFPKRCRSKPQSLRYVLSIPVWEFRAVGNIARADVKEWHPAKVPELLGLMVLLAISAIHRADGCTPRLRSLLGC